MAWADDFVRFLKDYSVDVDQRSGWNRQSGGRGDWTYGQPVGFIEHHFVNSYSSKDGVNMIENGYNGGPTPYIVNLYLEGSGLLRLVSQYPTGHPGKGSRAVLNRVLKDLAPLGDAAAVGMANDLSQSEAEKLYFGMEVQNPGDGTPLTAAQYRVMPLIGAAYCRATKQSANRVIQHREHTDRKVDIHRSALNSDKNRADVAAVIAGQPDKPVEKPKEWDEMATKDEIRAVVAEELDKRLSGDRINNLVANVLRAPEFELSKGKIRDAVLKEVRFKYENQPEGSEGTNNVIESINATNGQAYRNGDKLDAILAALSKFPEPEAPKA